MPPQPPINMHPADAVGIHKKINEIIHHNNQIARQLHNYRYIHPIDMLVCDVYYYEPATADAFHQLQHFCSNKQSIVVIM